MVRQWQDMFFEERFPDRAHAPPPDYAALAEAYGGRGFVVDQEEDLEETLAEAIACGRTAVVDCRVDAHEHCFPIIPAGAAALDLVEYPGEQESESVFDMKHTLAVLVENKPGVLARISNMSRAAASTSRAWPSGRPNGRRSRASRSGSIATTPRWLRSRSRCTSS